MKGAKCLNLCELRLLLEDRLRLHPMKSGEAHSLMKSSHQYATKFGKIKNRASVMLLREYVNINTSIRR